MSSLNSRDEFSTVSPAQAVLTMRSVVSGLEKEYNVRFSATADRRHTLTRKNSNQKIALGKNSNRLTEFQERKNRVGQSLVPGQSNSGLPSFRNIQPDELAAIHATIDNEIREVQERIQRIENAIEQRKVEIAELLGDTEAQLQEAKIHLSGLEGKLTDQDREELHTFECNDLYRQYEQEINILEDLVRTGSTADEQIAARRGVAQCRENIASIAKSSVEDKIVFLKQFLAELEGGNRQHFLDKVMEAPLRKDEYMKRLIE